MVDYNHHIKLLYHFGSDMSHYDASSFENNEHQRNDADLRLKYMSRQVKNNDIDCFKNSLFAFKLKTDLHCFYTIKDSKKYKDIIEGGFDGSYSIPIDLNYIKIKKDIKDFCTKGETWYNLLLRYTELGKELIEELDKENVASYNHHRKHNVKNYFKTLNHHKEYIILFSFYDFVEFFKHFVSYGQLAEIQEIAYYMLDEIIKLEGKPFNQALLLFDLKNK
jgi:hypothetical protein